MSDDIKNWKIETKFENLIPYKNLPTAIHAAKLDKSACPCASRVASRMVIYFEVSAIC